MPLHSFRFLALGTEFEITSLQPLSISLQQSVKHRVQLFDRQFSRFKPDSLVTQISKQAGSYSLPLYTLPLLRFYQTIYRQTDGAVTPLIGHSLEVLGYDASYSLKAETPIRALAFDEVVRLTGTTLHVASPVLLDFGAAGKGFIVDEIVDLLKKHKLTAFTVDASGDMFHVGSGELVGLEDPYNAKRVIGEVRLEGNRALCASAVNRRRWGGNGELHHVIDPTTGSPTRDVVATWVIADTTMIADGLATALFFCDAQALQSEYTYDYLKLYASGEIECSSIFEKGLYKKEGS